MNRRALLACALSLAACRPATEPAGSPEPAPPPSAAAAASERSFAGDEACGECHEEILRVHRESPHARTARTIDPSAPPPWPLVPVSGSAADELRPRSPAGVVARDAAGDEQELAASNALGSERRRVALLHPVSGGLQVLPLAWSSTRGEWVVRAEELGLAEGPEGWKGRHSSFTSRCAGCHPIPSVAAGPSVPMSPAESRDLPPGLSCEHCHGPGARHAALAREGAPPERVNAAIVTTSPDPWRGCGHCHARGPTLPLRAGEALRPADPLDEHRLFETAIDSLGASRLHFADGRPGDAHGRSAQSLEQSACFREGGATCTTCHEPHSGGLREPDPDASCRECHAEQAADPQGHARHPVATAPVPLAREEPRGPSPERAPGCVDCHAPAVLAFGEFDRVRDHAIGNPEPELGRDFGVPGACAACHGELDPQSLVDWLEERFPERATPRHDRALAFRGALRLAGEGRAHLAGEQRDELVRLLTDESRSESLRATAAHALGRLGPQALEAQAALDAAARSESLLVAQASLAALGRLGRADGPEVVRLARENPDWRVRLAAAVALDRIGDEAGAAELEVLAADEGLPVVAHAQARLQLGLALLRRGVLERAGFQFEEAVRLDPELIPAWLNLGVARVGLDQPEQARLAWLTVLDIEPGHPIALGNLARLGPP